MSYCIWCSTHPPVHAVPVKKENKEEIVLIAITIFGLASYPNVKDHVVAWLSVLCVLRLLWRIITHYEFHVVFLRFQMDDVKFKLGSCNVFDQNKELVLLSDFHKTKLKLTHGIPVFFASHTILSQLHRSDFIGLVSVVYLQILSISLTHNPWVLRSVHAIRSVLSIWNYVLRLGLHQFLRRRVELRINDIIVHRFIDKVENTNLVSKTCRLVNIRSILSKVHDAKTVWLHVLWYLKMKVNVLWTS